MLLVPRTHPRLDYLAQFLGQRLEGKAWICTTSLDRWRAYKGVKMSYGRPQGLGTDIPAHPWLLTTDTKTSIKLQVSQYEGIPIAFAQAQNQANWPFDWLAWLFFLLSRYEEYTAKVTDIHGRFEATQSLAYQANFLTRPVVDEWLIYLRTYLQKIYPQAQFQKPQFRFTMSYDIDIAFAYQGRPLWRTLGSLGQRLVRRDWARAWAQCQVLLGQKKDPFYTFDYQQSMHERFKIDALYFFLLADWGKYDRNIRPDYRPLQTLIQQLAQTHPVGIHPSYASHEQPEKLRLEIERLQKNIGTVTHSRQHFLRLLWPSTYRRLLDAGIQHDYTLGYATQIGFRASTAHPFYWYDLAREQPTTLRLHPLLVMDVTLKQYMQCTPDEAIAHQRKILQASHAVGGTAIFLWHNNALSPLEGWQGWRSVYEDAFEQAAYWMKQ